MFRKFVNREKELKWLEEAYRADDSQLLIIYGRRRVGKTELIKKSFEKRPHIYFLGDKRGTLSNVERFAEITAAYFNDVPPKAKGFDDVFAYIVKRYPKKLLIAIDEFSYLVEKDDSIPSVFQLLLDEIVENTKIKLVLCGSSVSMMERGVLSYKSPLYGRRTGQWKLNPLTFKKSMEFFPKYDLAKCIEIFSVVGGIPLYLKQMDDSRGILENVEGEILTKGRMLYEEVDFLLKEELREPANYMAILEAIAGGSTRPVEIANKSHMEAKDLPKYLEILQNIGIVERIQPVNKKKTKKSIYEINDNFFRFWFKFVYPNRSYLEGGDTGKIFTEIRGGFNQHVSFVFEDICREYLNGMNRQNALPFSFSKIGTWWDKKNEIDIVALNDKTKEILFGECEWRKRKMPLKELKDLEEKANTVEWYNDTRKEYFALFSKAGYTDNCLRYCKEKSILAFDLKSLGSMFKGP